MVPTNKGELRAMITSRTNDVYEDLTPDLIMMIDKTKKDQTLSDGQKSDEISLHMMGFLKSCTTEIMIDVLGEILGLE